MVIRKGLIQTMTPEQMLEGGEDATDSEVGGEGQQAARSMRAVLQEQLGEGEEEGRCRVAKGVSQGDAGAEEVCRAWAHPQHPLASVGLSPRRGWEAIASVAQGSAGTSQVLTHIPPEWGSQSHTSCES